MSFDLIIKKTSDKPLINLLMREISDMFEMTGDQVREILKKGHTRLKTNIDKGKALELKEYFSEMGAIVEIVESKESPIINGEEELKKDIAHGETIEILRRYNLPEGKALKSPSPDPIKDGDFDKRLITEDYDEDHIYIKELFRSLRTKIFMRIDDVVDKSLVITSMDVSAGKSTMSSNIAISIANQNWKTILIDGDLRRGVLHNYFDVDQRPGLSDFILSDEKVTEDSLRMIIKETHVRDLFIITSGRYTENSSDLLTSARFIKIKKILSKLFDMVILDTPPIGAVADPFVVSSFFSRYIIVVKAGKTNVVDLEKKFREYPQVRKKVLGLVLNYAKISRMQRYYKKSKYYLK